MATLLAPYYGQNTDIDAAAEELLGGDTCAFRSAVVIKAHPSNSGIVYVGLSNAVTATNGYPLSAGQEMLVSPAEVADAGDIFVIGSAANQIAAFRIV